MTLQDMMMLYGVTIGKRRSKKEKYLFARQLSEELTAKGWDIHVQSNTGRLFRVTNLIAGNLKTAKTLLVVPYDTPTQAIWSGGYYPFHPELTIKAGQRDIALRLVLAIMLAALACVPLEIALSRQGVWLLMLLLTLPLAVGAVLLLRGHSNPFNFNRASAAVATAVKLAEDVLPQKDTAIAFCDQSAVSYEGYKLLAKNISQVPSVIVLDSISKGDRLVLAYGPKGERQAQLLLSLLPQAMGRFYRQEELGRNLLSLLPNAMILTSGTVENGELVVRDTCTPRDTGLDLPRLEKIEAALATFTEGRSIHPAQNAKGVNRL